MASKRMSKGGMGGMKGQSLNTLARNVRSSRGKAVSSRQTGGPKAAHSRPMEFKYREIPFGSPRANLKGI